MAVFLNKPKTMSGMSFLHDSLQGQTYQPTIERLSTDAISLDEQFRGLGKTMIEPLDRGINQALPFSSSIDSTLNRGDFIEVQGPTGCGKTELLYFLAMYTILPQKMSVAGYPPLNLGGRDKSVIVCDCEDKWDIVRMHHIIAGFLRRKAQETFPSVDVNAQETAAQIDRTIQASLRRLHLFRLTSSTALAATLLSLPNYHFKNMLDEEICMLMIDGGLSSFFWQDRWNVESTGKLSREAPISPTAGVVRALQSFRSSHNPITFITNWAITPIANSPFFFRQHIPPPYPAPFQVDRQGTPNPRVSPIELTHHITLYNPDQSPSSEHLPLSDLDEGTPPQIYGIMRTPPRDTAETIITYFSFLLTDAGVTSVFSPIDEEMEPDRDCASQEEP